MIGKNYLIQLKIQLKIQLSSFSWLCYLDFASSIYRQDCNFDFS